MTKIDAVRELFAKIPAATARDVYKLFRGKINMTYAYNLVGTVRKELAAASAPGLNTANVQKAYASVKFPKPETNGHVTVDELLSLRNLRNQLGGADRVRTLLEALDRLAPGV